MSGSSAFRKELFRSIRSSAGRFLAIAGIAALGCGFYAGLRMSGATMRASADAYYDGTALDDIRLVSTLGFDEAQVREVRACEGVEQVMPVYSCDVMATLNHEQYAMRVTSFDAKAAKASSTHDGMTVDSDVPGYLDRIVLAKGEWPSKPDECLISADRVMGTPIKLGDVVEVLYGTADLDGVLTVKRFRVSGLVHASAYVSSVGLGYTSLGSGAIAQYLYVLPEAFDGELPYTQLLVTAEGAHEQISGSDRYRAAVDKVSDRLKDRSERLAESRLATIKRDALTEIEDAQREYDDAKAEADEKLADAKTELADAERELTDAEAELSSALAKLEDGATEIASGKTALANSRARLDRARSELAQQEAAWNSARPQLVAAQEGYVQVTDGIAQVDAGLVHVEAGLSQLEEGIALTQATMADLEQQLGEIEAQLAALEGSGQDELIAQLQAAGEQLSAGVAQAQVQLSQLQAQRDGLLSQQAELREQRSSLQAKAAEIEQQVSAAGFSVATLGDSIVTTDRQITEGHAQIASGQAQIDAAEAQIVRAERQYREGKVEYEEGVRAFEEGKAEYEDGKAEYERERKRALSELSDAAAQIKEARSEVDDLELPEIYVLDRSQLIGPKSYEDDSIRIDHIAAVFPLIFFLVAALVALTTMTRMVEDERQEIGTHKALGFSTPAISSKYLLYAALASVSGALVGIVLLCQILPSVIMIAYSIMYSVPLPRIPIAIDPIIAAESLFAGSGITLFATWAAAAATLRETPANLMLPRAPSPGKRILLERIKPIWNRLSFSWKVSFRNLFRYKRRLLMTVIGITGCTALLLTGLGLHDSIWDIIAVQYEGADPVFAYNTIVGFDEESSKAEVDEIVGVLRNVGSAEAVCTFEAENLRAASRSHSDSIGLDVQIVEDYESFAHFVSLRDRLSGKRYELGPSSVILTEKMATWLGIGPGDEILLYRQDDIGNPEGEPYVFTVDAVTENYVYHHCYVGAEKWREVTGKAIRPNSLFAKVAGETPELSDALHDCKNVSTVAYSTETIDNYRKSLRSVNMIVVVLIVAAAALAFIVLYNLTNINVIERTREIASLKVLGFTPREVAAYVFREVILLVIMGALAGLVFGTVLVTFVIEAAEVDAVMFGRSVHTPSYLGAFVLTLVFSVLVMAAMLPKLRHIDMVESLKSVD